MATATAPHFFYNVARAERSLRIHRENATRGFNPVGFRVGRHHNRAGDAQGTLKLLLWAIQKEVHQRMTLDEFLPLFAEYWGETDGGKRPPSWSAHRNLFELWRLWKQNPKTLVSDVFELDECPFVMKEVAAV